MRSPVLAKGAEDGGDDEVTDSHPRRTRQHDRFAAKLVDVENSRDGGEEHGHTDNTRGEQAGGIAGSSQGGEDGGCIVQDGVDASELLEEHRDGGDDDAAEHGLGAEEGGNGHELELEDVPGLELDQVGPFLRDTPLLEGRLGFDLEEFEFDEFVVFAKVAEVGEHLAGFLLAAVMEEPAR